MEVHPKLRPSQTLSLLSVLALVVGFTSAIMAAYSASIKDTRMTIIYFWLSVLCLLPGVYVLFHLNMVPVKTEITEALPYSKKDPLLDIQNSL